MTAAASKINGDALFLPIAIAGGIEPTLLVGRRGGVLDRLRLGHRWRRAKICGRIEVLGPFHVAKMEPGLALAKH